MSPVTIKNDELIPTLIGIQILLVGMSLVVIIFGLFYKIWLLLLLLLLTCYFLYRNQKEIKRHQDFHLVLNEQDQWHFIHVTNKQVIEAQMDSWWQTPSLIAVKLSANEMQYWYMMTRHKIGPEHFSRLIVGLESND